MAIVRANVSKIGGEKEATTPERHESMELKNSLLEATYMYFELAARYKSCCLARLQNDPHDMPVLIRRLPAPQRHSGTAAQPQLNVPG